MEALIFLALEADKPGNGRDKNEGEKRQKGNERIEGLREEKNLDERVGKSEAGRITKGDSEEEEIGKEKNR